MQHCARRQMPRFHMMKTAKSRRFHAGDAGVIVARSRYLVAICWPPKRHRQKTPPASLHHFLTVPGQSKSIASLIFRAEKRRRPGCGAWRLHFHLSIDRRVRESGLERRRAYDARLSVVSRVLITCDARLRRKHSARARDYCQAQGH